MPTTMSGICNQTSESEVKVVATNFTNGEYMYYGSDRMVKDGKLMIGKSSIMKRWSPLQIFKKI